MSDTVRKVISSILKLTVIISAAAGTVLSAYAGRNAFMGGVHVFMYFTIQTNIAITILCFIETALIIKGKTFRHTWHVIKFAGTVAITLTGMVFCFILAPTMSTHAWNIQNILTHVVVPVASIADFFVSEIDSDLSKADIIFITLPPLAYTLYAGIGYIAGWEFSKGKNYPYFFLNWGSEAGAFGFSSKLPYMGCVWWIIVLLLFLILTGHGYLFLLNWLRQRHISKAAD